MKLLPAARNHAPPSPVSLWLLRWLLFRLMFASGVVKLASGDPVWWNLTALTYHYETQCLPPWTAWYAQQLPRWFHIASAGGMFFIELVVPFFVFFPRFLRLPAFWLLALLQVLIALAGNYCFFNLITLSLCLLLVDDASWPAGLRRKLLGAQAPLAGAEAPGGAFLRRWPWWGVAPPAAVILPLSLMLVLSPVLRLFEAGWKWPPPLAVLHEAVAPFHVVNGYGLFADMTTERPEIIVEGSRDGAAWKAYEFPYKPGDLSKRPRFVAPHQPRLDWQMWFAALGSRREQQWFVRFCLRLLEGSEPVLGLLAENPFPEEPPRYVRALLYDYRFTTFKERKESGNWWKRELKGLYLRPISLRK